MLRIALTCVAAALAFAASAGAEGFSSSVDTEMLRWNAEIPGFGGFFYDEEGAPTVYLLDPAQEGAARETFGAEVQVRQGEWEFRQLQEWKSRLVPVLSLPGAVLLDIDEEVNRLSVGLDATDEARQANRERVEEEIAASGVPREAVVVEEIEPAVPLQTLSDVFRPAPGGVQISFATPSGTSSCTLGFNVHRQRFDDFGFLTASHCSRNQGWRDGTVYNQPSSPERIGVEVDDPDYVSNADPFCPPGRFCRYSDTLFARYDDSGLGAFRSVARTAFRDPRMGSRDTVAIPFRMARVDDSPIVGTQVEKVGAATGWTFGRVTRTCADVNVKGTSFTLLCQHASRGAFQSGDSGAPVFRWGYSPLFFHAYTKANAIQAVGLLWGRGGRWREAYFSSILNIEADLGTLSFY